MQGSLFDVTDYGATGDGTTRDTDGLQSAIDACGDAGGGIVFVPGGEYVTTPLFLRSNVRMHLSPGATILGATTFEDYPVIESRDEGIERETYAALITAVDAENVSITGQGTIDGRGDPWWEAFRADEQIYLERDLPRDERYPPPDDVTIRYPRPRLINPIRCRNVVIRDVTLRRSPYWTVHLLYSEDVLVDDVTIVNPPDSPNTDGINPDSCRNVKIRNCHIDVGDDCIALKSGYDEDGLRVDEPLENVTISGCTMRRGHGGVVIGSETSGDVRNVTVGNCLFDGTTRGLRIKSAPGRGGVIENVQATGIVMRDIGNEAFTISMHYDGDGFSGDSDAGPYPRVDGVQYSNVVVDGVERVARMEGLPGEPLRNVHLSNVHVRDASEGLHVDRTAELVCDSLEFDETARPVLSATAVDRLDVDGLGCSSVDSESPVVRVEDVDRGLIRGCHLPDDAEWFVENVRDSSDLVFSGNRYPSATPTSSE
jgi:polygalacturonase